MSIDQQFITLHFRDWEGRMLTAYIPCYVKEAAQAHIGKKTRNYTGNNGLPADYTVMGASGVTIGTGCDLGQQTSAGLRAMGVPIALVAKFAPYMGKSKDAAIVALHNAPFTISEDECDALDLAVHGDYVRRIARIYDEESAAPFADIPREAQAVVAHLFYHLGHPKKYPNTWAALVRQDWQTAADKLRNFAVRMRELEVDLERLAMADRASARKRESTTGDNWTPRLLAALAMFTFAGCVGFVCWLAVRTGGSQVDPMVMGLVGTMTGYASAKAELVYSYYFGSSVGSQGKDRLLYKSTPVEK